MNIKSVIPMITIGVVCLLPITSYADDQQGKKVFLIKGQAATGVNDYCNEPIWNYPVHYSFLGEFDTTPGAMDAIALNVESCEDGSLVLATTTSANFMADFGIPTDADSRLKNLPLNRVPVTVGGDGSRSTVPFVDQTEPTVAVLRGVEQEPTTLSRWMNARGYAVVKCKEDEGAIVSIKMKNLIPNGVYTLWEIWDMNVGGAIGAVPLGGIPNVITANHKGKARYKRILNHCPFDALSDGRKMIFMDAVYHSDGNATGGAPALSAQAVEVAQEDGTNFVSAMPVGIVSHTHMVFPIGLERL